MATTDPNYTRKSLSAALVQLRITQWDSMLLGDKSEAGDVIRETIARAQSISTNDELAYAPVFQIGYGGVVEHVPLRTQGSGQLSRIESIDGMSLYRLGIHNFVSYLQSCNREPLDIAIHSVCGAYNSTSAYGSSATASDVEVDLLMNVKFTSVARMIDVGGQLVGNTASFVYLRRLGDYTSPGHTLAGN